ncbi:MAG: hypothetical protein R6U64_01580 [Bacteroidales bacterium]
MENPGQQQHYEALRKKYPLFVYESCSFVRKSDVLELHFEFSVGDEYFFKPRISIPYHGAFSASLSDELLYSLTFHVGMVEMISYWKAFCSPRILVKPFGLNPGQQQWWKKLFRYGLGEFFYTNGITIPGIEVFSFEFPRQVSFLKKVTPPPLNEKVLIPVGGGKDSVVSLELLKQFSHDNLAVVVNHRGATRQVLEVAGFGQEKVLEVKRTIDPLLLQLNEQGFLNGHTPFSALLAFVTSLSACLSGSRYIALSNESSANEVTIPGTIVNHQYSKSLEFERDFREYFADNIFMGLEYFSFLRPLNELQIAALFSQMKPYHPVFKSCNAGSKTDSWCGTCSKCLFTWIILSPFIPEEQMRRIFGKDLFEDPALRGLMDQLTGASVNKPFECVGTLEEVNVAMATVAGQRTTGQSGQLPVLLEHYVEGDLFEKYKQQDLQAVLEGFHQPHFLAKDFEIILQKALDQIRQ